ncbi:Deoxyribose-phosphate aldolase [Tolypocladium ophioglossoides CBS 100239]|uniref:deoxyribose-phosphate aldolase n=1 Tax=Tolypocladium ophioglossoides (strain CBS 100239) TaxID=1163406 RepID=A0A0L0MY47_TOLOC|nr:Deoxyribose-phosphate aldolase [Tolypocladium ophioglossoides CBS 100239]
MAPNTVSVSLPKLAKLIDHSLLHPTLTDADIAAGLALARSLNLASACVKPYAVPAAAAALAGTDVLVCAVVGFPHGSSTNAVKLAETDEAMCGGATEIDMVANVGKALSGEWHYVEHEIEAVNRLVTSRGGALKVIFENDYLQGAHIVRLCDICTRQRVAFVKTSTGYGFVKQPNGMYSYKGATVPHLKLMRQHTGPDVQIKAAGGVRTLDELLYVMSLGVTRVGASATQAIMDEARARGIGEAEVEVEVKKINGSDSSGAY